MRVNKYIIAIAAGIFSLSMLSGCQSNKKADMNVSIQDGQVQTKLAVAKGSSVSDILKEAEITLNKKDQITPSLTTKLDSGEEKIEIARYEKLKVSDDNKEQEVEILGGGQMARQKRQSLRQKQSKNFLTKIILLFPKRIVYALH